MDPPGAMVNAGGGGGVYNFAEIWPGFHASATSYSMVMDPVEMDQRSNHCPPKHNSRKRGHKRGASASNSNEDDDNDNCPNVLDEGDAQTLKVDEEDEIRENQAEVEGNSGKATERAAVKPAEQPKQDYIHVRARRGQATDSHSLAERARREKISERMKILQDLVPGCNKVIGKALVLDEIINYIQALQRQVEFLSMKLEAVNARVGVEGSYQSKDQSFDTPGLAFTSQGPREYGRGSSPEWLHMQLRGGFEPPSS